MKFFLPILCLVVILIAPSFAFAQGISVDKADTSQWPTVTVSAIVLAGEKEKATSYTLQTLPDGKPVAASALVKQATIPQQRSIVVAVDTSRSLTQESLTAIKDAVSRYVDQLDAVEQMALLGFNDSVQLVAGFTHDKTQFKKTLGSLQAGGNTTELYRAMLYGLDLLKNLPGSRSLLVITDGKDEGKEVKREQVQQLAEQHHIQISSVAVPLKTDKDTPQYLKILEDFAQDTGGLYRVARNATELKLAGYEILLEQRKTFLQRRDNTYLLTFTLIGPPIGAPTKATLTRTVGDSIQKVALTMPPVPSSPASQGAVPTPAPPVQETKQLWLYGAGAVVALLLLGAVVFLRRKKGQPAPPQAQATQYPTVHPPSTVQPSRATMRVSTPVQSPFVLDFVELGLNFPLAVGTWRMGAHSNNDIVVDESTVSGQHAEFHVTVQECRVQDMRSTNGTVVNGVASQGPIVLKAGDQLLFGKAKAMLRLVQPAGKTVHH